MPYTDFHYVPTGTGVISGKEVLEQTEDAINDLGQQTAAGVDQAIDTANNAMNTANTAMADAQNAVNVANTAQTTATNAQNTANAAQTTATNAQNAATAAQNDVDALENVVTGIDGRLTTTEGNVTNLTTRMTTAEGNITTLQNDVLTAQGTATSAQNTATLAREQAYVTRYTNTAVSDNSTVAYAVITNTDNIKINDLLLDTAGKLYQISAVDTSNETVFVTTPLTQLAVDSDVLHKSGDETKSGELTLQDNLNIYNNDSSASTPFLILKNAKVQKGSTQETGSQILRFIDKNNAVLCELESIITSSGACELRLKSNTFDSNNQNIQTGITLISNPNGVKRFCPSENDVLTLGYTTLKWANAYLSKINNVEPSSLSLPSSNYVDISGSFTNTGSGDTNSYTALSNGWIYLRLGDISSCQATVFDTNNNRMWGQSLTGSVEQLTIPILKGQTLSTQWATGSSVNVATARFIPCRGNV